MGFFQDTQAATGGKVGLEHGWTFSVWFLTVLIVVRADDVKVVVVIGVRGLRGLMFRIIDQSSIIKFADY